MMNYDRATNANRYNRDPHFRFYLSRRDNKPTVVQVQDFDYEDYDDDRFIGPWAFTDEKEAQAALESLLIDAAKVLGIFPDFLRPSR